MSGNRHIKRQWIGVQMPGASPDQNVRQKQKTMQHIGQDFVVEESEVLPLCYAGHTMYESRGRCKCGAEICQSCQYLICEKCGQLLCRPCSFIRGGRVICNSHGFIAKMALQLEVDSSPDEQPPQLPQQPQPPRRQIGTSDGRK